MIHVENAAQDAARLKASGKLFLFRVVLVVAIIVVAFAASRIFGALTTPKNTVQRDQVFAPQVEKDHAMLLSFQQQFPSCKVLLGCEEDVTNDGKKDLLVIYKDNELVRFVTCIATSDGFKTTEPIPAPVENQGIQFRDIDKKDEIEFIISGQKKGAAGYGIYRMIDGQPKDLFGDGMDDCC